jgi:ubiquinone biosynthesis protein
MWDTASPFVKAWIRDELGPEAALADRLRNDAETLFRIPELVRRLEEQFPPKGGAPDPPPLPEVELMWERRERKGGGWLGYAVAALLGGVAVWGATALGWISR